MGKPICGRNGAKDSRRCGSSERCFQRLSLPQAYSRGEWEEPLTKLAAGESERGRSIEETKRRVFTGAQAQRVYARASFLIIYEVQRTSVGDAIFLLDVAQLATTDRSLLRKLTENGILTAPFEHAASAH